MSDSENYSQIDLSEGTKRRILSGFQLSRIKEFIGAFSEKKLPFEILKDQVSLGYGVISSLQGFNSSSIQAIKNYNIEAKKNNNPTINFNDYKPESWKKTDPELQKKFDTFVQIIDRSLEICRQKYGYTK